MHSFQQAASQRFFWYQEQEEPNRVEAVLGFSLKSGAHGRRPCSENQSPQQKKTPVLILRQFLFRSFQQTAATASSFSVSVVLSVPIAMTTGEKNCVRGPLDSRSRGRFRTFVQRAKESCSFVHRREKNNPYDSREKRVELSFSTLSHKL